MSSAAEIKYIFKNSKTRVVEEMNCEQIDRRKAEKVDKRKRKRGKKNYLSGLPGSV